MFQPKIIKEKIMIKFNYKDVAKEQGWNFAAINPIEESSSDYYYYKEVLNAIKPSTVMLDIGCGSGEKAIRYFSNAKKVVMIDNEPEMLVKVNENKHKWLSSKEAGRFIVQHGDADGTLDFPDESFDLVVSRHCGTASSSRSKPTRRCSSKPRLSRTSIITSARTRSSSMVSPRRTSGSCSGC